MIIHTPTQVRNGDLTHTHPSDTPLINIGEPLTRNEHLDRHLSIGPVQCLWALIL